MKHCTKCDQTKARSEFAKCTAKPDGLQVWCRICLNKAGFDKYVSSADRRASVKARRERTKKYNKTLVTRYKRLCGCRVCTEKEPVVLDLHHLDPTIKEDNPSAMMKHSTSMVKAEIRKCVVLCSNCHRKVHAGLIQL